MAGHRNFREIEAKMSSERLTASNRRVREMMAEMLLVELRKHTGFTQEQLAAALGITQPALSKFEAQDDMQISTLSRIVKALGGELEIVVRMPQGRVKLTQFAA
ncbi:MAG TPA: XRE family transcriptional regulator [Tepidisphaeraceae bacterium]|nr:XRE family transcriptional regulator [Tepidisphaeraceae bacterium]